MAAKKAATVVDILIVRESFVVEVDGEPVAYRTGEPVHPDDPVLKKLPESHFEPLVFPHTPQPEIRS